MSDLFVSLITVTPKLATVTAATSTIPLPPLGQAGTSGFGGLFNELGQRKVQTPGKQ